MKTVRNFLFRIKNISNNKFTFSILLLYFLFLVFLPFVYSKEIIDPVLISRQLFLSFFLFPVVVILCFSQMRKNNILDVSFIRMIPFVFFLVFCMFNIISGLNSLNKAEYYYVNSKYLIEGVFFFVTIFLLIQNQITIRFISKSIILFAVIIIGIAFFQIAALNNLSFSSYENIISIKSTSANKNLLSSILFITLPFIFIGFHYSKQWKVISLISLLSSLFLIWVVQTRIVWISTILFIGGILVFAGIQFLRKQRNSSVFAKVPGYNLIPLILLISIFTIITFYYKNDFTQINFNSIISSSDGRMAIWKNSVEIIKDNYLWGVGSGNWQFHFPEYGLAKFSSYDIKNGMENFQRPHNDYLWIFSESGFFGFISYLIFFFSILFYSFKLFKNSNTCDEKLFNLYFFLGLAGYSIIAFFDFPLERIEHQIIFLTISSIILSNYYLRNKKKYPSLKFSAFKMTFIPFIIIIFSIIVSVFRYKGEYHTHKLYDYRTLNNWDGVIKEANLAQSVFYNIDPMSTPILWYRGVSYYTKNDILQAKKDFNESILLHPNHIHVLNNLATCCEKTGDHYLAQSFYKKALKISPDFSEARLNLSALYFNDGKINDAFEIIDKCPTECDDLKYLPFLNAILKAKIDLIFNRVSDEYVLSKLSDLKNNPDVLFKVYINSKRRKESFDNFLKKNIL